MAEGSLTTLTVPGNWGWAPGNLGWLHCAAGAPGGVESLGLLHVCWGGPGWLCPANPPYWLLVLQPGVRQRQRGLGLVSTAEEDDGNNAMENNAAVMFVLGQMKNIGSTITTNVWDEQQSKLKTIHITKINNTQSSFSEHTVHERQYWQVQKK